MCSGVTSWAPPTMSMPALFDPVSQRAAAASATSAARSCASQSPTSPATGSNSSPSSARAASKRRLGLRSSPTTVTPSAISRCRDRLAHSHGRAGDHGSGWSVAHRGLLQSFVRLWRNQTVPANNGARHRIHRRAFGARSPRDSSYHLVRSPTFARLRQRNDLGSRLHPLPQRPSAGRRSIARSSALELELAAAAARIVSMVPRLVRQRPQSPASSEAMYLALTVSLVLVPDSWSSRIAQMSSTSFWLVWTTCSLVSSSSASGIVTGSSVQPIGDRDLVAHLEVADEDVQAAGRSACRTPPAGGRRSSR